MSKKIFILLLLFIFSYGVHAVSDKKCLFSEMRGVVNFNGKPASNVRLVRKIKNKQYDETVTDEKGEFHFPVAYQKSSLFDLLPSEFVVKQEIIAYMKNKEYIMWSGSKRVPEENAESRGKPLVVSCELSQKEPELIIVNHGPIFSLCKWDVEEDIIESSDNPFGDIVKR